VSLASALTTAILPVLSVAAAGFVLGRVRDVDVDALAAVTIYVLTPALVFHSLATSPLSGGAVARVAVGVTAFTLGMVAVAETATRALGHDESLRGAVVLTSTFPNAGNYGIPLAAFAFGGVGRSTAVLYIAAQAVLMYAVGVYLASRSQAGTDLGAVREVFRLPLVYAVAAALLARAAGVVPAADSTMMATLELTGNAAIPVMLLLLGIQLANNSYGAALGKVGTATALKLAAAPLLALGVVLALGFENLTVARVFVLECAMPAAITPLMLTIEYGGGEGGGVTAPEYVSTAIMVTTLLSVPVLTVLIAVLQSGVVV
jgi:predicted permease